MKFNSLSFCNINRQDEWRADCRYFDQFRMAFSRFF